MASGAAVDIDALYQKLGIDPQQVVDLSPKMFETTAWVLSRYTPLLAGIALLLIMFELKTPGVGWFAVLGGACAALFLVSQYYLDMAENFEVVLMVMGLVLVSVEFFTMVGAGVLGLIGALMAFAGLAMLFLPNELDYDLSDPRFLEALSSAAANSLLSVGVVAVGLIAFIVIAPHSRLHRRLMVRSEVVATSAGDIETHADRLVGRIVRAREMLRPSGTVEVDGMDYSARSEHGAFVSPGTEVEIIDVQFGELIVRALSLESGPEKS